MLACRPDGIAQRGRFVLRRARFARTGLDGAEADKGPERKTDRSGSTAKNVAYYIGAHL
jgi:hypothetical protein